MHMVWLYLSVDTASEVTVQCARRGYIHVFDFQVINTENLHVNNTSRDAPAFFGAKRPRSAST